MNGDVERHADPPVRVARDLEGGVGQRVERATVHRAGDVGRRAVGSSRRRACRSAVQQPHPDQLADATGPEDLVQLGPGRRRHLSRRPRPRSRRPPPRPRPRRPGSRSAPASQPAPGRARRGSGGGPRQPCADTTGSGFPPDPLVWTDTQGRTRCAVSRHDMMIVAGTLLLTDGPQRRPVGRHRG